jgi:hypothetical protein
MTPIASITVLFWFDEYVADCDPLIPIKARLNLVISVFDNDIVGKHVNNMKWAIRDVSASPYRLLTSDRPVRLFKIIDAKGMITLPISPTKLFVAANNQQTLNQLWRRKPLEIVSQVNTDLVERARRFVWAYDESQTAFIQKYMSTGLEPMPFFPTVSDRFNIPVEMATGGAAS